MTQKTQAIVTPYAGLKASCRHIAAQYVTPVPDRIRFAVGSTIVGKTNQIQVVEYDDAQNTIQCVQTLDHADEIWWLNYHTSKPDILFTISSKSTVRGRVTKLFEVPEPDSLSQALGTQEHQSIEEIATFNTPDPMAKRVFYLANDDSQCVISCESSLYRYDIEKPDKPVQTINIEDGITLTAAAADPLHAGNVVGTCGKDVLLWDLRQDGKVSFKIEDSHSPVALDVAFNANKSLWIVTGGADGNIRCWDIRNSSKPLVCEFHASSHWVTRAVPSDSHEQLILTSGTDSKVRCFNASQFAFQNEGKLPDGEIIKSVRHDDSVYCVTWAANNPWVFASVSYKGQVVVCQLPSQVVDSILMGDSMSD